MERNNSKAPGKGMKGQFFLLGAFLLIMIFYVGIALYFSPSHQSAGADYLPAVFDNIKNEYPVAFNLGMNASDPVTTLANFTAFAVNMTGRMNANLDVLWIVTENVSDNLNVTVGNFLEYPTTITLNVSGDVVEMRVDSGGTNSSLFTSPPSEFELRANFNTTEKNLILEKYKANLYVILEMTKGNDKIAGEMKA